MRHRLIVLLTGLCLAHTAAAQQGAFHDSLTRATDELAQAATARSPASYVALHQIWQLWDRADPARVEATLRVASENPRLNPAERSYAALLAAYSRIRRGDVAGGAREVRGLGFVDRWWVLGPYDNEGKAGLEQQSEPLSTSPMPVLLGHPYSGKGKQPIEWRRVPTLSPYGLLDFGELMRPAEWGCSLAATFVQDPSLGRQAQKLAAYVGVSGAFKLYWNGQERLSELRYRDHDPDRVGVGLALAPGVNVLIVKACGATRPPVLSVRLAHADGRPYPRLQFADEPPSSLAQATPGGAAAITITEGPLQRFEALLAERPEDASLQEAFARYLQLSRGDDEASPRGRDLAYAAAERAPTLGRFLLAAQFAESPHQRELWLARAARLTTRQPEERIALELAQGQATAAGLHWQDAFAHFRRAEQLDPGNLEATLGLATLYDQLGLTQTAVAVLEQAVDRTAPSVLLLNYLASGLRKLGRETEAVEAERRYNTYRFDDRGFLAQQLQLSVLRRNQPEARRWGQRLLQLEPSSAWTRQLLAQSERRFGNPQAALAIYQESLIIAPGDLQTLESLAELHAELGQREPQLATLRQMLGLRPQDKATRDYLDHLAPDPARADEQYAWPAKDFLRLRHGAQGHASRRSLVDLKVRTVYENGLSSVFRQVVFQPLTDSAASLSRQYVFQYEATREQVQLRGARVFRNDGRIEEAVETGEAPVNNPELALYTSQRNVYVQFPRLEAGDVVELRYRIDDTTHRNEFADYFGEVTYLGSSEPVARAEYVLRAPKSRQLYFDVKRLPQLVRRDTEQGDTRVYRFSASDLPAIVPEPAMPPWSEVLGYVHVSTYRTYQELGRWYWDLIREQLNLDAETRRLAQTITGGLTSEEDKVAAVYDWVTKRTRYVALEFGIYGYKPRRAVQTVSRGWGDCKDKAAVIISLLEAIGIEATMTVVRTQLRGGFDSQVPSFAPFDHAVAYVPSLDLYLDGTAEFAGYRELPALDSGALALLVNGAEARLTHLPALDAAATRRSRQIEAELASNGDARLQITLEAEGAHAPEWRRRYDAEATREARLLEDVTRSFPGFALNPAKPLEASGLDTKARVVRLLARGDAPGIARQQGSLLQLTPTIATRLTPTFAALETRKLALAIPPLGTLEDRYEIRIPPGFELTSSVPDATLATPFGSFGVVSERSGDSIVVRSRLTLLTTRVTPEQYPAWKAFCEAADAAFERSLVFSRRGTVASEPVELP